MFIGCEALLWLKFIETRFLKYLIPLKCKQAQQFNLFHNILVPNVNRNNYNPVHHNDGDSLF